MRLSFSNIAWDPSEDDQVAALLRRHGVDAIDVAPTKYFLEPARAGEAEIKRVRRWWSDQGIVIAGMQALLFGTQGLNLFGSPSTQSAMLTHLDAVCRIAAGLGATRLVFGSPKNRDRSGLCDDAANSMAVEFFDRLAVIANSHSVLICLEPNPPHYGCNFMTSSAETAHVVKLVARESIRMQLDTGAIGIAGENVMNVLAECALFIGHIHASEPDLVPLGDGGIDHCAASRALTKFIPEQVVTIEMLATKEEPHLASMERALRTAIRYYRSENDA